MIWALAMMVMLQVGVHTQGDDNERVEGTHGSAPQTVGLKRRLLWATAIALALWVPLVWVILSGVVTMDGLRALTGRPIP
ncbi:DUF1467 family protein [Jannaschia sp. W003]|uniref:DUF1467 family protein n=1 Tax=Jannaschia sp. W003 TaxID=2867012 RepID=UPI0021A88AF4|nr:DUF1467 family protein [Jannaschia sp. W003]